MRSWTTWTRYLDNCAALIDINRVKSNRFWALVRSNWLFAALPRGGERAGTLMNLIQLAKFNRCGPYTDLKGELARLES